MTLLLIIPLVTLVGLLTYSFVTTLPGFIADRHNTVINNDVGGPLQDLLTQLNTETALTYASGSLPRPTPAQQRAARSQLAQRVAQLPPAQAQQAEARAQGQAEQLQQQAAATSRMLAAQRPKTDAAIAAFDAGQAKLNGTGYLPAQDQAIGTALVARLKTVRALRAQADQHTASPLTVFKGYLAISSALFPYVSAMPNTHSPVPMFSQSVGTLFMGQALSDVAAEASLGNGALENGGTVTKPVYQLFQQLVFSQRQLDQTGTTMLSIASTAGNDPYVRALRSPRFMSFTQLENKIIADGPNAPLPATAQAWQQQSTQALGALAQGETAERTTVTANSTHETDVTEYELAGVGGLGLLLVLLSSLLLFRFGNRVSRELRDLRAAARSLAFQRLPDVVSRLRDGQNLDTEAEAPPLELSTRTREVTETAGAFSAVQRTAVQAAIEQSALRHAVSNIFRRLARRNQGLLQRQLKLLDEMERGTHDPEVLGQLFRIDHLTTRMRRQAEGLIILSGAAPGRGWREPVQVVEVLRGAVGEIEDYVRVDLAADSLDYLQGTSVADVTHLLAELIENAVAYSPPNTRVQVRGGRVANGYVVDVEDRGLGIPPDALNALNQRLAEPPDFDVADSDQLGLFVVSRLAARHGIQVSLRQSSYGGITAIALLPHALVVTPEEASRLSSWESDPGRRATGAIAALGNGPSGPGRGPSGPLLAAPAMPVQAPAPAPAAPGAPTAADGIPRATGALNGALNVAGSGPDPAGFSGSAGSAGGSALPQRQRLANLPPQFRPGGQAAGPGGPGGPGGGMPRTPSAPKSPEQTRTLMSSIQKGLRHGRRASSDGSGLFDSGAYDSGPGGNGPEGGTR